MRDQRLLTREEKTTMYMKSFNPTARGSAFLLLAVIALLVSGIGVAENSYAASGEEIDTSANVAMKRFYQQVEGAKEFVLGAKGLLIMPNVKKAAFIIGGEYGEGALRIGGKTAGYYNIVSGSFGLQIGAQAKDIIIAFMTREALDGFRASQGWEAGVDGNVALITIGAGERVDTRTIKDPIVGFVFDVKGLIADLSLKGAKFTKLDK
jgi:lipid-binding SYLF domain-containing protein